ncbi:MAG TPA: hypothetical protein VK890_12175 [Bacteroidia bacterium]|nr:hypothetical protein [Bacteroidia bacterium]
MLRKFTILATITFLLVRTAYSQVSFTEKKYSHISRDQYDISYDFTIPVFNDTSTFFKSLNKQIEAFIHIENTFRDSESVEEYRDTAKYDSAENKENTRAEDYEIGYDMYFNSVRLLCFGIHTMWSAGGIGVGSGGATTIYMVDLKAKKMLGIDDFFSEENIKKVMPLFDKKLTQLDFGSPDSTNPYAPAYNTMAISKKDVIVFYTVFPSGSKMGYSEISIPLTDLKKYMTAKGKELIKN